MEINVIYTKLLELNHAILQKWQDDESLTIADIEVLLNNVVGEGAVCDGQLHQWLCKYIKKYIQDIYSGTKPPKPIILEKTLMESPSSNELEILRTDEIASADDTPDDTDYLNVLGIINPDEPWNKYE